MTKILIHTPSRELANDLANSSLPGLTVAYTDNVPRRDISGADILLVIISVAGSIPANVLSSWLYDKLKNRDARIIIDDNDIEACEKAISSALNSSRRRE